MFWQAGEDFKMWVTSACGWHPGELALLLAEHVAFIHHRAGVAFGTHYIVSQSAFRPDTPRGFAIYLGKAKVTANFNIESSPREST